MALARRIILAAGGTGGHVFPAVAALNLLQERGDQVLVLTDDRGQKYWPQTDNDTTRAAFKIHVLPSGGLVTGSPVARAKGVAKLGLGYLKSRRLISQFKPDAVVGFGGYPSVGPLLAAQHKGVASLLHEQNSVMGKANQLIAKKATFVATSFAKTKAVPVDSTLVGNPVRQSISNLAADPYEAPQADQPFKLFVMGGSLGAAFLSDILPKAIGRLPADLVSRLKVHQQARSEDLSRLQDAYNDLGVSAKLETFVDDVAAVIKTADLTICRSGATSVAEMAAAGRPAIFIPLDIHADRHQVINAESLANKNAAWVEPQSQTSPEALSCRIEALMNNPEQLQQAAQAALALGNPDAAERLVALIDTAIDKT